ncbi:MAG: glycosyltransferase [Pseudomonadota bacterium]
MIALGPVGHALVMLVATLVVVMALAAVLDRTRNAHRALLLTLSSILGLRYLYWRATETLPPADGSIDMVAGLVFFVLEATAMASALSANLMLSRVCERSSEADTHANWWGDKPPRVAVMIATYNEDLDVLERTVYGAMAIDYPNYAVYLLDDGRRENVRAFAEEQGVIYVTRPDNAHAKAGNINHALGLLADDPPDFVTILDADFVAHDDFLQRSLALFHAPDVALVQTPQHFFNPDPIQQNLGLIYAYPDEQRFFFNHLQPARDAWGLAICCGTSSVARWRPLEEIGFFPTDSVTEDFLLTLALSERGWRTVYLDEPLSEGLAPEGLKEYITQRARWCLGLMQIARGRYGPLSANRLGLLQRWSVIDSVLYWAGTYPFRLAALCVPLLYWYGNILVVDAGVADVIAYFGVYFVWALTTINFLTRGTQLPFLAEVSALVSAIPIALSAWGGLVNPEGRAFKVTAKGGDRSKRVVQWTMMRPFLVLFCLSLGGLALGLVADSFAHHDAGDGKAVVLFWTLWNLVLLGLTMQVCIERPRREIHVADPPRKGRVLFGEIPIPVWASEITSTDAHLRGFSGDVGETVVFDLPGFGRFDGLCSESGDGWMRIAFLHTPESRRRLLLQLHTSRDAPGLTEADPVSIVAEVVFDDITQGR